MFVNAKIYKRMVSRFKLARERTFAAAMPLGDVILPVVEITPLLTSAWASSTAVDLSPAAGTHLALYTCPVYKRAKVVWWNKGPSHGAVTQSLWDGVQYLVISVTTAGLWLPGSGVGIPEEVWLYPGWALVLDTNFDGADIAIKSSLLVHEEAYDGE